MVNNWIDWCIWIGETTLSALLLLIVVVTAIFSFIVLPHWGIYVMAPTVGYLDIILHIIVLYLQISVALILVGTAAKEIGHSRNCEK